MLKVLPNLRHQLIAVYPRHTKICEYDGISTSTSRAPSLERLQSFGSTLADGELILHILDAKT